MLFSEGFFFHYVTREIRGLELFSEELLTRFYEDRGIKTNGGGFMALRLLITSCYSGEQEALDRVTSVAEESQALAFLNSTSPHSTILP